MKSTTNVFLEGLRTDLHPLSTGQLYLTDALNATMITYNGNEMMIQNDMGNTRILDSATGNIMSLSPGFIPVGMKEHGGIMYIASVNKDGLGEIGTIPSPIIRDMYKDKVSIPFDGMTIPVDTGDPIQITNKLYPADKFIANLQMTIKPNNLKGILHTKNSGLSGPDGDPCDIVLERLICNGFGPNGAVSPISLYSPVISYSANSADKVQIDESKSINIRKKGIYKLNLYSSPEQGKSVLASDSLLSSQVYGANGENKSQYWFLHTDSPTSIFPKDLFNATLNKDLKQVPVSNKPGKLAVELIPELITDFGILPRADELFVPITYKTDEGKYYTYFPGFYYTSDSGLYVEKLTARVIDESTNSTVNLVYPYKRQEIPLFNKYDLSDLSYDTSSNDAYTDLFLNGGLKLWIVTDTSGLPHSRSFVSGNTLILSPIAGLFNHEKTSFKSSTQGKDDSPHSGVFYADLGDKYQNWYRLEVDYEDLYGGNKGTFTTRFNPYINDVFGTNLSVDGVEGLDDAAQYYIIGDNNLLPDKDISNLTLQDHMYPWFDFVDSNSIVLQVGAGQFYSGDGYFLHLEYDSKRDTWTTDVNKEHEVTLKYSADPIVFHNELYMYKTVEVAYPEVKDGQINSLTFGYGFENHIIGNKDFYTVPKSNASGSPDLYLRYRADVDTETQRVNVSHDHDYCLLAVVIDDNYNLFGTWNLGDKRGEYTNESVMWLTEYSDATVSVLKPKVLAISDPRNGDPYTYNIITTSLSEWNSTSTSLDLTYSFTINNMIKNKYYRINKGYPPLKKDENIETFGAKNYYTWQIGGKSNVLNAHGFRIRADLNVGLDGSVIKFTAKPSYQILSHYLLQGTNDIKTKVYVLRFHNMIYEHNFESDSKGISVNYISDPNSYTYTDSAPCSYNELAPFKYLQGDVYLTSDASTLEPGIYVLNIQRCPGVGNWTLSKDEPLINLQINIGEASYNVKNWSTGVLDTNEFKYKTPDGTDTSNMRIYTPVVLVIPNNSSFEIKIQSVSNEGHMFTRQNLGLYKIREVVQDEIVDNLGLTESDVYLYQDYMRLILNKSAQLDTVKQYAFMLKYGAFFKEAFVFVDGLYKDGQVNPITIGTKTYRPYPYIPSDPSILPVNLGEDGNYYWNTYYMPEEVLTSDDCEFIFSNASDLSHIIDAKFKSVQSGKLRQLINQ